MNVAVFGSRGKVGTVLVQALAQAGHEVRGIDVGDPVDLAGVEAMVDFTQPDAVEQNVRAALEAGVACVVGTTGLARDRLESLGELAREKGKALFIAPNFSIGAVLMMRFATEAARFFESVEIIELHHPDKVDAPSGTARRTAELIAAARREAELRTPPDATSTGLDGARGAEVDGIHVHSLRVRGLVAHQEVVLGGLGETLTIRHDSLDRTGFMPGLLLGVREVSSHPGLTVGLEPFLGLD